MSLTLAVNDRNDLFVGTDGNLARYSDIQATMQAAAQAAKTQLGEMIYAVDEGIPNFDVIWSGAPNLAQYDAALRGAILAADDVQQILSLVVTQTGDAVSYTATIQTVYGTAILNG